VRQLVEVELDRWRERGLGQKYLVGCIIASGSVNCSLTQFNLLIYLRPVLFQIGLYRINDR
jgi:hypothetical protein